MNILPLRHHKIKQINMTQEELKKIGCSSIEDLIAEDFGEIGTPERDAVDDDDTPRDVMAAQLFLFFDIGPHCAAALLMAHDTLPELFVPDVRCRKVDGMVAQAQRQLFGVDALSRTLPTGNQNDFSFHGGKVTPNRGYGKAIHKD